LDFADILVVELCLIVIFVGVIYLVATAIKERFEKVERRVSKLEEEDS